MELSAKLEEANVYNLKLGSKEAGVLKAATKERIAAGENRGEKPVDQDVTIATKLSDMGGTVSVKINSARDYIVSALIYFDDNTPNAILEIIAGWPPIDTDKIVERYKRGKRAGEMAVELSGLLLIEELMTVNDADGPQNS